MVCNIDESHEEDQNFDLDDDFGGDFDNFDDGASSGSGRGVPKIAGVGGTVLLIIAGIFFFGGSDEIARSNVRVGSAVSENVGTEELDPNMIEALETLNQDTRNDAIDTQSSFIPIPITPAQNNRDSMTDDQSTIDPLETWKAIQNEKIEDEPLPFIPEVNPGVDQARDQALVQLAEAMSEQMQGIITEREIRELEHIEVTPIVKENLGENIGSDNELDSGSEEQVSVQIISATAIEYGQTLLEANTDWEQAPVLAELVTGPLAGARLIGEFKKEEDFIILTFSRAVKDGKSYEINAIAIDTDTLFPAMQTEIDRRWFRRVIVPAAADFVSAFAEAVATTTSVTVVNTGGTVIDSQEELNTEEEVAQGIAAAAQTAGDILKEDYSDVDTLIRVPPGTPIGILFVDPVCEDGPCQRGGGNNTSNISFVDEGGSANVVVDPL